LKEELEELLYEPMEPKKAKKKKWSLIFDPDMSVQEDKGTNIENYRLSATSMR
jgi:hypothetical protein